MTADPIAGGRGERNFVRRFCAFVVALSKGPPLKDRLAVEIGKIDGQRDQFFAEVMGTEVFGPVVVIVDFSR